MTAIASLLFVSVAPSIGLAEILAVLIALMRTADAAVDMAWGFDMCRLTGPLPMKRYAYVNTIKLLTILTPAAFSLLVSRVNPLPLLIGGAAAAAVITWAWLLFISWGTDDTILNVRGFGRFICLARASVWFALGYVVVAFTSNAPRMLADRLYSGDLLGVVGVTLSFSTLLGMIFLSSWLRWFPRLAKESSVWLRLRFVLESSILAVLVWIAALTVFPRLVALLFKFDYAEHAELVSHIIQSATVFMLGMNVTNLFKTTALVWRESAVCLSGVIVGGIIILLWFPDLGISGFLSLSGAVMLVLTALLLGAERRIKSSRGVSA